MASTATEKISKIEGVKMAHAVTGPFDVIAYAEVSNLAALSDLVLAKIQTVKGVEKTQTALVVTSDASDGWSKTPHVKKLPARHGSRSK